MLVIGLMSGTSLDGVDAALVEFGESAGYPDWSLRAFVTIPYIAEQRERIHGAIREGGAAELCRLNVELGEWLAAAALAVCEEAGVSPDEVEVIGSHGQTIWHEPPTSEVRGATLQLGCAATIAELTGIPVVSDFRARDMAAGGEGAPLVPWVDKVLFSAPARRRILLNIGGMANLTWLPPAGEPGEVLAFDTGPGNALIDAAIELATNGARHFDGGGEFAARGRVDDVVLADLLAHPYLAKEPPKSTGRELFGHGLVQELAGRIAPEGDEGWADLVATLTAFTARSIAGAVERWCGGRGVDEVVVTGGGARNPELFRLLAKELAPIPLLPGEELGFDPDAKEAVAFALLARGYLRGETANLPEVTGAAGPRILGSYTPGSAGR